MSLTHTDVDKIAQLARLNLNNTEKETILNDLNNIFAMIEKMQSVNTDGIDPMANPHEIALTLREDIVTETDHALEYQSTRLPTT